MKYRVLALIGIFVIIILMFVCWAMIDMYPAGQKERYPIVNINIYFWWMWIIQPILLGILLYLVFYLGSTFSQPHIGTKSFKIIGGIIVTYFILLMFCFEDFLFFMIKYGYLPFNEDTHLDWMFMNSVIPGGFYGRHFMFVVLLGWLIVGILWYFILFKSSGKR